MEEQLVNSVRKEERHSSLEKQVVWFQDQVRQKQGDSQVAQ